MRLFALVALLGGLFLAAPTPAHAAEDPVTRKKVQTYLDLAADLFKSGDYEGALVELRRAEALSDLAVVRFNIARCLEQLKRDGEASAAFERYLALNDATDGAAERQKRARDAMARLGPAAPSLGVLDVQCPAGSSVQISPIVPVPVPCPWRSDRVPSGIYDVQTMTPGHPPMLTRAQVAAGLVTTIGASAAPTAAPGPVPVPVPDAALRGPPMPVRFTAVRDGDEFEVNVDGATCRTPCELQITPGKHRVEVTGAASYSDSVNFPASAGALEAKIGRRKGGFLALGIASVCAGGFTALIGLGLTANGVLDEDDDTVITGLAVLGTGVVVAIAGGIVGFKLKGSNDVKLDDAPRSAFAPQLIGLGVTPTPHGGAQIGAAFAF